MDIQPLPCYQKSADSKEGKKCVAMGNICALCKRSAIFKQWEIKSGESCQLVLNLHFMGTKLSSSVLSLRSFPYFAASKLTYPILILLLLFLLVQWLGGEFLLPLYLKHQKVFEGLTFQPSSITFCFNHSVWNTNAINEKLMEWFV